MVAEMNATPTSVMEWGEGKPTLVFLHYFGGAATSWKWVAEQLPDFRCVAIDLPGFGGTPALDTASLSHYAQKVTEELEQLAIADYILVGHSMGGKIALQVAVESDRPPQKVVLVAPSPPTQEPMPDEEKQRLLNNHPSQENAETTVRNATRQELEAEARAIALETHMAVAETAWRWWLLEGMNHSIADQLTDLKVPVTVVASKDDPVIPFDVIQRDVLEQIPNSRLVSINDVGHLIPLEVSDWLAMQLRVAAVGERRSPSFKKSGCSFSEMS